MSKKKKNKKKDRLDIARIKLQRAYEKIPATQGCLENIQKEDGCQAWCCSLQNPQVLYVEFLNAWKAILESWRSEDIVVLVQRALETYISNEPTKGCILFDAKNKLCLCHGVRSFSCRMYGIVPQEEFASRLERVKKRLKDFPGAVIRDQCDLVSTVDDSRVETIHADIWWDQVLKAEMAMGIPRQSIHDGAGGSYRTYHDHLLVHLFPEETMQHLTTVRLAGNDKEKEIVVKKLIDHFKLRMFEVVDHGTSQESKST